MAAAPDTRPAAVVMKQFREMQWLKQQLVRMGQCDERATPRQVIAAVRAAIPADLMDDIPPA